MSGADSHRSDRDKSVSHSPHRQRRGCPRPVVVLDPSWPGIGNSGRPSSSVDLVVSQSITSPWEGPDSPFPERENSLMLGFEEKRPVESHNKTLIPKTTSPEWTDLPQYSIQVEDINFVSPFPRRNQPQV